MNFTYKLCYDPHIKEINNINFACSDKKIHFRFTDYNSSQEIKGFEQKLTYLMTYLFNYYFNKNGIIKKDNINEFLQTEAVSAISSIININNQFNTFAGFKAAISVKKDANTNPFGVVIKDCFPIIEDEASLEIFCNTFKIDLFTYLFNDAYSVIIERTKTSKDVNSKFIKKVQKHSNLSAKNDLVKLW